MKKIRLCGARTRSGGPCRKPAMKNGRCRLHGGESTGPRTPEGLKRSRRARWKHGRYAAEKIKSRRKTRALIRLAREICAVMAEKNRLPE